MKRLLIIIGCLACSVLMFSQSKEDLERQKQRTLNDIEESRQLLERASRTKETTVNRVNILNRGIQSRNALIDVYEQQINDIDQQITDITVQIEVLQTDIARGKAEYAKIVESIYKNHTNEDKIMYLLASETLNQFYQRIKYMKYLTDYRERKIEEINSLIKQLDSRKNDLNDARAEKLSLMESKEEESRVLSRERDQKRQMIQKLTQDERRIRQELKEKERIKSELEAKIRKIIEEEARKTSSNSVYATLTPEQRLIGDNFSQNKGRLPWPVDKGIITANFGLIDHPVLKGVKIKNNGIDISSSKGTIARAVYDGEVSKIFAILGANYTVIIMHGEYLTVYQNLVDLKVKTGDHVKAKQEIGTIFSDEDEGVAVLHFQVWKEREILDPVYWISK